MITINDLKKVNNKVWIIEGVVVLLLLANSLFIVPQTKQAIVLQFGKPVKFKDGEKEVSFINTPGLKMKVPFIQNVVFFDSRVLNFEATDKEVLDLEKKALTVNAFAKYKITDPLTFYEKVTNKAGIDNRLDKIFEASLRDAIGSEPLKSLLTGTRKDIMKTIQTDVSNKAKDFGIEIFDVRIVRADLPKENSEAIFKRMFTDRNKEAREYRAQGKEQAQIIVSTAEKEATIIQANAEKEAQIIKGEGDATASKTFADAFSRDPEFYDFYRAMQAYRKSINKDNTRMVLSPDSEFMNYFKNSKRN
ncbi:MAG: hflC [Rickettsiaceae bacterium]|jgi:membrane protease subunit HflC|nr:hflC [Rickettsiaceae bacterium]